MRTAAVLIGSIMVGIALAGAWPQAAHRPAATADPSTPASQD